MAESAAGTGTAVSPPPTPGAAGGTAAPPTGTPSQTPPGTPGAQTTTPEPAPKTTTEAWRHRFRYEIDGQETEREFDESQVSRLIQKGMAADQRFSKAAELARDAQRIIQGARDPRTQREALAELLGGKEQLHAFLQAYASEQLENETLTDEQKQLRQLQAENERLRGLDEERAKTTKEREQQALVNEYSERLEQTIADLSKAAGLPAEPWAEALVLDVIEPIVNHGIQLTREQIIDEIKDAVRKRAADRDTFVAKELQGPALLEYLGKDIVKRVLAATLEAHKKPAAVAPPPKPACQGTS